MPEEFKNVVGEFKKFSDEMKDPVVVGALLNKLAEERAAYNLVLREINAKLDRLMALEAKVNALKQEPPKEAILSDVDGEIMAFVQGKEKVCAEDVQARFKYKGKNGASARLNALARQGLLRKVQAGKKVYFLRK